jgi:hypothetical protein
MLQGANDQKDDDHQEAEYITAKFKLITPSEHNNAFEKTPKQNLAYRHNNASEGASIRILNARKRSINYGILNVH